MDYSNPEIPEGINTTKEHPLREFFILGAGVLGLLLALLVILLSMTEVIAARIPFSVESRIAGNVFTQVDPVSPEQAYIDALTLEMARHMDLPDGMRIRVHYMDDEVQNAFATLGGNIFIHRGLLQRMPSENALAMVIAHEIAHVKHRHPVLAMGRGVVLTLFLASVTGFSNNSTVSSIVSNVGTLTALGYSRKQEREADSSAIDAVYRHYGHVNGAGDLFRVLLELENSDAIRVPQFLSTHPLNQKRIDELGDYARSRNWPASGEITTLPSNLAVEAR